MSTFKQGPQASNYSIGNFDVSKIFLRGNRYQQGNDLNNSTYDPLVLPGGTLMGRVVNTGTLAPLNAAASDGTQYPVGVLAQDISLAAGETKAVTIVDFGDVAEDGIVFIYSGQGLETAVSGRRMRDLIEAQGIKLITRTEMTQVDPNQ